MSRRRRAVLAAIALCVVALAAGVAAAWHFSSAVLVPDRSAAPADTTVVALPPGHVVLERTDGTRRRGVYGLKWQGGRAIVGAIVGEGENTVTRRLRAVDGYLAPGMKVPIDPAGYAGNPPQALGLPSSTVPIRGELGSMPAWLVPGRARTWAIVVHGINSTPETGLRVAPALHRAGVADRRPVHGALPARPARGRAGARRAGPRLEGRPLLQRHRDGLPLNGRGRAGVGDRRPHRRRLGRPRRAPPPPGLPAADPALPRNRGRHGADRRQRRLRRPVAALGHLLPRAAGRPHRGLECRPWPLRTPARRLPGARGSSARNRWIGDRGTALRKSAGAPAPTAAQPRAGRPARAGSPRRRGGRRSGPRAASHRRRIPPEPPLMGCRGGSRGCSMDRTGSSPAPCTGRRGPPSGAPAAPCRPSPASSGHRGCRRSR